MPSLSAQAVELARRDPDLGSLIAEHGPLGREDGPWARRSADPYVALAHAIVSQQVSSRAAAAIWERLTDHFEGFPEPRQVVGADPMELRSVGLSGRKVSYLRDLAEQVLDGELDLEGIAELSDEAVIERLLEIRGIGRWTAEMFLMFHLGRPDVVAGGDLGIRKAVKELKGLEELPTAEEVVEIAEAWRPNRTLACLYLWRSIDEG